ncbi:hypothetical protein ERC79_01915 [Rhodococcus sp. ABRD24]|uniref:hypothetical protein n=1 Tax=Rhodococcus sp. ABRD24 TaxID=2507582 RepID=UPI00103FD31A|nr:hypothetical protein [Rhodococcus sp. ABRD24]QBJ94859.1 hypothetical protein ERC79_01915 [Rhodococcus sp. ABRD24]
MLVMTLVLAAVGFALLVIALMTGSVIWAWGCISVCVAGAVLLLVSALANRRTAPASSVGGSDSPEAGDNEPGTSDAGNSSRD